MTEKREPTFVCHVLVFMIVVAGIVPAALMLLSLLRGTDKLEAAWDALAMWVSDILDADEPETEQKELT